METMTALADLARKLQSKADGNGRATPYLSDADLQDFYERHYQQFRQEFNDVCTKPRLRRVIEQLVQGELTTKEFAFVDPSEQAEATLNEDITTKFSD